MARQQPHSRGGGGGGDAQRSDFAGRDPTDSCPDWAVGAEVASSGENSGGEEGNAAPPVPSASSSACVGVIASFC